MPHRDKRILECKLHKLRAPTRGNLYRTSAKIDSILLKCGRVVYNGLTKSFFASMRIWNRVSCRASLAIVITMTLAVCPITALPSKNLPASNHPQLQRRQLVNTPSGPRRDRWNFVDITSTTITTETLTNVKTLNKIGLEDVARSTTDFLSNLSLYGHNNLRVVAQVPNRADSEAPEETVVRFLYTHTPEWVPEHGLLLANGRSLIDDAKDRILSGTLRGFYYYITARRQNALISFATLSPRRKANGSQVAGPSGNWLSQESANKQGLDNLAVSERHALEAKPITGPDSD